MICIAQKFDDESGGYALGVAFGSRMFLPRKPRFPPIMRRLGTGAELFDSREPRKAVPL